MAIREIPTSYEFTCDGCGHSIAAKTKSRPAYWCDLTVAQDAYDYQGCAVADATIRKTLCSECRSSVVKAINSAIEVRRAALSAPEIKQRSE